MPTRDPGLLLRRASGGLAWLLVPALAAAQVPDATPPLTAESEVYSYLRVFFPPSGENPDFDRPGAISAAQKTLAEGKLKEEVRDLLDYLEVEEASIGAALKAEGMQVDHLHAPSAVALVLDTEGAPLAAAGDRVIMVSARSIRGFLAGSLREALRVDGGILFRTLTRWPRESGEGPLDRAWYKRFQLLLDLVGPTRMDAFAKADQKKSVERLSAMTDPDAEPADIARFEQRGARILAGLEVLDDIDAAFLQGALVAFTGVVATPAENFLLGHELGHVVLHSTPAQDETCADIERHEMEADTFALALMAYGMPGMIDAMFLNSSEELTVGQYLEEIGDPVRYGFPHAIRYGIDEAGLTDTGESDCRLPAPEQRIAALTASWKRLVARRLTATRRLGAFEKLHPAVLAKRDSAVPLSAEEQADFVRAEEGRCAGVPAWLKVETGASPFSPQAYHYTVFCRQRVPKESDFPADTRLHAGKLYFQSFLNVYEMAAAGPPATPAHP